MRENAIRETRDLARESRNPGRNWEAFEHRLAAALGTLDDECVVVSEKGGNRFVQFSAQPSLGLRAEVVSNAYLEAGEQLRDEQLAAVSALGWSSPKGTPEEATPEKQPQRSPNFFRDFPRPVPCEEVARMAVRTLADVLGIADPSHLEYRAFDAAGHPLYLPALRLADALPPLPKKPAPAPPAFERLRNQVRDGVLRLIHDDSLDFDADSEIPVRLDNAVGYVRVLDKPLGVRVYSVLAPRVGGSESLLRRIHEINVKLSIGRLVLSNGTVYGSVDILVPPFVAAHLIPAFAVLDALAGRLGNELRAEFGRPAASDELPPGSLKN